MSGIDELWLRVSAGDRAAFGDWMGRVERPIRLALAPWARLVDAEGLVQETALRMWLRSQDRDVEPLVGERASLRYAIGIARNLARNMARRAARLDVVDPAELPEPVAEPAPPPDPMLARAIRECIDRLAKAPLNALRARIDRGHGASDRELAEALRMKPNTFVQNLVRARRQLARCLEGRGVSLEEVRS